MTDMSTSATAISSALNEQRDAFRAFVSSRVSSRADAEDILQNGMARAFRHAEGIEPGKATAWFYQLLRNAIVDHYRQRATDARRKTGLSTMLNALHEDVAAAPEWERQLCGCLKGIVATMPPKPAELIRRVDLEGEAVADVASDLKISANNASVMLHRARKDLRARLERFCGACADGACLDCECQPMETERKSSKVG